jgi:hypothetical protein
MKRHAQAHAFSLGGRDAYIHFPSWCDDLERRMMTDWIRETHDDGVSWLDVREAAYQGWEERQAMLATDPHAATDSLLERARDFGASHVYQRFACWSDDLEYKLQSDWRTLFGGVSWDAVRDAVKQGWQQVRQNAAPI